MYQNRALNYNTVKITNFRELLFEKKFVLLHHQNFRQRSDLFKTFTQLLAFFLLINLLSGNVALTGFYMRQRWHVMG